MTVHKDTQSPQNRIVLETGVEFNGTRPRNGHPRTSILTETAGCSGIFKDYLIFPICCGCGAAPGMEAGKEGCH